MVLCTTSQAFFQGIEAGKKAGFPRFKSRFCSHSLTFKQLGNSIQLYKRISNRRKNFIEQEVCKLMARFGLIAVEVLVVCHLIKNSKLAKSIADASWLQFFTCLLAKAEEADGRW